LLAPTQHLFDAVDSLSKKYLTEKWTGSIKFLCVAVIREEIGSALDKTYIEEVDICDYLGQSSPHLAHRLYLDPVQYDKPPLEGESISKNMHWIELKKALELAAHTSGSPIMCNGGTPHSRAFKCKLRNRQYRPPAGKKDGAPRQDDCINMDKGGRRHEGRSLSKRTRTTQALKADEICPFRFTVRWDSCGFYVTLEKRHYGSPCHENHVNGDLSNLTLPIQLIPEKEKEILRSMTEACIGGAVGRNYVFTKMGMSITKSQMAYFASEPSGPLADGLETSDTDSLLQFFQKAKDISYHTLWDVPHKSGESSLISSLNVESQDGFAEFNHNDDPDFDEPRESAKITRENQKVHKDARIFIAVAWADKYGIRTFYLFPEVFHADCTCDTNNTNNHLLTFSCRTSTGKQVVFLRIWLPNQKRSTFRWVFKFVLTSLFDERVFRRTRLVMVDGDPQQKPELKKAISQFMRNAVDGGCGWHIVEQGWKRHIPGNNVVKEGNGSREKYNLFVKQVKNWCYSWMIPGGVESEEEYLVSKQLLFAYFASPEVLDACGGQPYIVEQVSEFVRNHVLIYDDVFLFYPKKYLRYFDVKTSSAHEGTNLGIKEHAAAVLPSHKIDVAGKKLSLQSSMKGTLLDSESTFMASSQCLWSSSPTANHVTTLAESIISRSFERTHDYEARRTSVDSWEVHYVGQDNYSTETERRSSEKNSPIPIFTRIRVVNSRSGFLCCDCGAQQRLGLTCVHAMAVMESFSSGWKGPTHHDVSPRWWVVWMEFAHQPKTSRFTSALLALMENEVPGPKLLCPVPDSDLYIPLSEKKSALTRVKNYSQLELERIVPNDEVFENGNVRRTFRPSEGLTQESYIVQAESSGEDSNDEITLDEDHKDDSEVEGNVFANSLLVDNFSTIHSTSARDILKPHMNEVLQCLDTLKTQASMDKATKLLNDFANEMRLEIGTTGRKRNIENCLTVNINVEENLSRKSRTYASKNC
jgi:hypothetical protein